MKRKVLNDYTLGFSFVLQIGGTELEAYQYYDKIFKINSNHPTGVNDNKKRGIFSYNECWPYCCLIWINKDSGAGTMAHESAHAAMHVCSTLGINPVEADEFQATYTGFLSRELANLYFKKKKK